MVAIDSLSVGSIESVCIVFLGVHVEHLMGVMVLLVWPSVFQIVLVQLLRGRARLYMRRQSSHFRLYYWFSASWYAPDTQLVPPDGKLVGLTWPSLLTLTHFSWVRYDQEPSQRWSAFTFTLSKRSGITVTMLVPSIFLVDSHNVPKPLLYSSSSMLILAFKRSSFTLAGRPGRRAFLVSLYSSSYWWTKLGIP